MSMSATIDVPDEVWIVVDGAERQLSIPEFLELPLSERVGQVLRGTARFYRHGKEQEPKAALAAVRRQHMSR